MAAGYAAAQTAPMPAMSLTASADNAGSIKIDILRWSSDAERDRLLAAWTHPVAPPPAAGGRGRGRAAAAPDVAGDDAQGGTATQAAGGRGAGGRGGGRGGNAGVEGAARPTPESSLATALENAPTVGYLWSSAEVSGYALRYAVRLPGQDGGERVVLITERKLGAWNDLWKPAGASTDYEFSVIELRLNAKGAGEGRASLTGKVGADTAAKTIALENYGDLPLTLKNVAKHKP